MRETIAIVVAIPLLLLVGGIIYFVVTQSGTGVTENPRASVVFDLRGYDFDLPYTDFTDFYMFENVDCRNCTFENGGPLVVASSSRRSGAEVAVWYQSPYLSINFYGQDESLVKSKVREFVAFLRSNPKFEAGFEIRDRVADRMIPREEETTWYESVSVSTAEPQQ